MHHSETWRRKLKYRNFFFSHSHVFFHHSRQDTSIDCGCFAVHCGTEWIQERSFNRHWRQDEFAAFLVLQCTTGKEKRKKHDNIWPDESTERFAPSSGWLARLLFPWCAGPVQVRRTYLGRQESFVIKEQRFMFIFIEKKKKAWKKDGQTSLTRGAKTPA